MQSGIVALRVLNPIGKTQRMVRKAASPRLSDLNGKRIGVLSNGKASSEMLLPFVEAALKKRVPTAQLRIWRVPFALSPELKEPQLREIAEYSDGVIAFMGD